ncbi:MAG: fibronectin type III domain-containing protein, partial [Deltaproteobacteria bacterium]|nr:fibronectin type III domain-containing protein [Deltaproteobacteria bacterium]
SDFTLGDTEGETDSDSGGSYSVIATVGANVTSYTDTGLEKNATYSYRVRAFRYSTGSGSGLRAFGEESNQVEYSSYSNEAEEKAFDHCFIATAAYGSLMEPHVATLRQFRNKHLTPYKAGRALVETYYTYSPPIADFIAQHETLRAAVRIGLMPLVALSYSVLHIGPVFTLGILIFIMLLSVTSHQLSEKNRQLTPDP